MVVGKFVEGMLPCVEGVSILTRKKMGEGEYSLKYQCLCPIDFVGQRCRYHKEIRCYLKPQSMEPK